MATAASALPRPTLSDTQLRSRSAQRFTELWIRGLLLGSAGFSILTTSAIVLVLAGETWAFFHKPGVTLADFFWSTAWNPLDHTYPSFGVWPLLCGTFMVTAVAMSLALPLGLITAIFLSEYAPERVRAILKPTLELLAGVPTVVYGYFALNVITPGLQLFHDRFEGTNIFSAGIAVGILCLPIVSSLSEDALRAVPRSLREAAYAVGGTKFDVSVRVVVPAALSGIISAFLLAIARSVGETMIVALAAGNTPRVTLDPRMGAQTMTGSMTELVTGEGSSFSLGFYSMYAVAAKLFLITLTLTFIGQRIRLRYQQAYQ
jgi:phosphate transport system permease protein